MIIYIFPALISSLIFIILIPLFRKITQNSSLVDLPDAKRKFHSQPVPRIGGIALFISIIITYFYYSYYYHIDIFFRWGVAAGLLIIFLFGVADDLFSLSPRTKFIGQLLACFFAVYYGGIRVTNIGEFLEEIHVTLGYLSIPFTIVLIVGIINAVNMSDGLDGLTGGLSVLTFFGIFILAHDAGNKAISLFSICILGAIFGFLRYNTYPATIFLGDSGSQLLGFCLSIAAIQLTQKDPIYSPLLLLFILGFPLIDIFIVCHERIKEKKSIFFADRNHFHYKLLQKGLTHQGSVVIIYVLQTLFILFAFVIRYQPDPLVVFYYFILMAILLLSYFVLNKHLHKHIFRTPQPSNHTPQPQKRKAINRTHLAQFALICITILVLLFFFIPLFLVRDIPQSIFIYSVVFFIFIGFLVFSKRRERSTVVKLGAYFLGATFLYLLEFTNIMVYKTWYSIFFVLIIGSLLLFIVGTNELLPLTSLDYFVFFFLIIVPHLPVPFIKNLDLTPFLLKLFALFYSIELIDFKKKSIYLQCAILIALGCISLSYITQYILHFFI